MTPIRESKELDWEGEHMKPYLTPDEISALIKESTGKLTDWQCRTIVHYMMGFLRHANGDVETTRQEYFRQIKRAIEGKPVPI